MNNEYIEKLKKSNPELFLNGIIYEDSIAFIGTLKYLKLYLLEGGFKILENFPRSSNKVEAIMDYNLKWDGPDFYIAYNAGEYRAIENLEEFLKNNF